MVRFVQRSAIEQQLAAGNLVLLTNIGVSSSGELLNCNAFDVSCAGVASGADAGVAGRACWWVAARAAWLPAGWQPWGRRRSAPRRAPASCSRGVLRFVTFQPASPCNPTPESSKTACPLHHASCHAPQVATHAATELRADKLLIITGEDVRALSLPHYLPLVRLHP